MDNLFQQLTQGLLCKTYHGTNRDDSLTYKIQYNFHIMSILFFYHLILYYIDQLSLGERVDARAIRVSTFLIFLSKFNMTMYNVI